MIEPFQIFDLIPKSDFLAILDEKHRYFDNTSKDSPSVDLNSDIGNFRKVIANAKIELIKRGVKNPQAVSLNFISQFNRFKMDWHKHRLTDDCDPYTNNYSNVDAGCFYISIYYPHNIYHKKSSGKLIVKKHAEDEGTAFEAVPNSIVFHNGYYGHEVNIQQMHPILVRDACFIHWIAEKG